MLDGDAQEVMKLPQIFHEELSSVSLALNLCLNIHLSVTTLPPQGRETKSQVPLVMRAVYSSSIATRQWWSTRAAQTDFRMRERDGDVELGLLEADSPRVHIESWWTTGWAAGGEIGSVEEAAGGGVGAAQGTEVEARVIGAVHGAEGGVIVAACGMGEWVREVGQAVGPSTSATRVVGPLGGVTRSSVGRTVEPPEGVVRPPKGAVRLPAVVPEVPALRCITMGESTGSISYKNS
jgi:hypothetical protein